MLKKKLNKFIKLALSFLMAFSMFTAFGSNAVTEVKAIEVSNHNDPSQNPFLWAFNQITGHSGGLEEVFPNTVPYSFAINDLETLKTGSVSTLRSQGLDCSRGSYALLARGLNRLGVDIDDYFTNLTVYNFWKEGSGLAFSGPNSWQENLDKAVKAGKVLDLGDKMTNLEPGDILMYGSQVSGHIGIFAGTKGSVDYAFAAGDSSMGIGNMGGMFMMVNSTEAGSTFARAPIQKVYRIVVETDKEISVSLTKTSSNPDCTNGNAMYSLEGAKFDVYIDGDYKNKIGTLTTNAQGKASGKYTVDSSVEKLWIKETKAPKNYVIQGDGWTSAKLSNSNTATFNVKNDPLNDPALIGLEKQLAETSQDGVPFPKDYQQKSLAGAEFTINYYDGIYDDVSKLPAIPTRSWVIKTKENGKNSYLARLDDAHKVSGDSLYKSNAGAPILPLGTITVQETKPADGYTIEGNYKDAKTGEVLNSSVKDIRLFNIVNEKSGVAMKAGNLYSNEFVKEEIPAFGGVEIQKRDLETLGDKALGGASLEGAEYEIYNAGSEAILSKNGEEYISVAPGELVTTITTDADGKASTSADALMAGKYTIKEVTPPKGYLIDGNNTEAQFEIAEDGEVISIVSEDAAPANQVIRGDVSMRKIASEGQKTMGGIEFKITSLTTGESHTFTTDENGYYSTASDWNPHSKNTNAGGAEDGIWFGEGTEVNDKLGALPYDTYEIEEIKGENNKDMKMFKDTFTVKRNMYEINLGNIENVEDAKIRTKATSEDGLNLVSASKETVIIDTVTYEKFKPGMEVEFEGILMNPETEEPYLDAEGKEIKATTVATIEKENGEVQVKFVFDATKIAGNDVVIFEYARDYATKVTIATHEDPNDDNQTVTIPEIKTKAKADNGTNVVNDTESVVIDTISYKNLIPGKSYIAKGEIYDATAEKLTGIVSESEPFTPSEKDGEVEVRFEFDGSAYKGHKLVVFEKIALEEKPDTPVGEHEDPNDEDQTVYVPEIKTRATDPEGKKNIVSGENAVVVDTVEYKNLEVGVEYIGHAELFDATTEKLTGIKADSEPFTPEEPNGTFTVKFEFDATPYEGHDLVVYENISMRKTISEEPVNPEEQPTEPVVEEIPIAKHEDPNDKDQTVKIGTPEIKTIATTEDGTKNIVASKKSVVVDTISYKNLDTSKTYVAKGTIYDATDNKLTDIKAESEPFKPEVSNGTVKVKFTFDGTKYEGHKLVVFEQLYVEGEKTPVAVHEDPKDKDQTVTVLKTIKKVTKTVNTGVSAPVWGGVAMIVALLGMLVVILSKKKEIEDEQKKSSKPEDSNKL